MNTKKYQSYYDQFPFVDKLRAERRENVLTKLVLALACALLVAIFALQNAGKVVVAFLLWHFEVSLALVILGSTLLGAVFVFLLGLVQQISRGRKIKEYRLRIKELEEQLAALSEKEELPLPVPEAGPGEGEEAFPQELNKDTLNQPTEGAGS
ncbi:MAG TPA: DUF1049 domain-containing protein [Firmicutes bacterium]|jgi:uncharacterized integral membrane protein|nr:DUF1049 domain-containing protein [Bacillota bacterium]